MCNGDKWDPSPFWCVTRDKLQHWSRGDPPNPHCTSVHGPHMTWAGSQCNQQWTFTYFNSDITKQTIPKVSPQGGASRERIESTSDSIRRKCALFRPWFLQGLVWTLKLRRALWCTPLTSSTQEGGSIGSLSLRPAWSIEQIPGQSWLQRETLSWKNKTTTKKKLVL